MSGPELPWGARFKEMPKKLSKILSKVRISNILPSHNELRQKEVSSNIDHVFIYSFDIVFIMDFLY